MKKILLFLLLPAALLSCVQESQENLLAAREAEELLQPMSGKTLLLPYNTPGGSLALPFSDGTQAEISMDAIASLSDNGKEISIGLKNRRSFLFPKEYPTESPSEGPVLSVVFQGKDNTALLLGDLTCRIEGRKATCEVPYLLPHRNLIADITLRDGYTAFLRDDPGKDIRSRTDFALPTVYIIEGNGQKDSLTVQLLGNTGLPALNILTENGREILSKEEYLHAEVSVRDNALSTTSGLEDLESTPAQIRGRGNSTWNEDKKPYKIKFQKKTPLLGMPAGKQWVLLANAIDKSQLKNTAGFSLSEMLGMEWTPRHRYVDLFINNRYRGMYQLTEQIKTGKERVNVSDGGYLLEIDAEVKLDPDDVFFSTDCFKYVVIKDPDTDKGSEQYNAIRDDFNRIEKTLFSTGWLDGETGYKTLLDIESFAKWYVIHELSGHDDHAFHTSCYMHRGPDGKLKAGPVWDFDQSFGGFHTATHKLVVKETRWFRRLFEDPDFMKEVSVQFKACRESMPYLLDMLEATGETLDIAHIENNTLWHDLSGPYDYTGVRKQMKYHRENLKTFLQERLDHIESSLFPDGQ